MKKQRSFLLTGATGFIGSCLLRRLVNNNQNVSIIIRKNSKLWRINDLIPKLKVFYSDLSNQEELKKILEIVNPDVIYHLATSGAYSAQNDPDKIINTNIIGTWNMIKASFPINYELFINTGSSSEYGLKDSVMKEDSLLEPDSYYAVAKSTQTLLSAYVAKVNNKPIVTIRPFSVYGPYEEPTRLVPALMDALLNNKQMNMVNPDVARDMIYIDDIVNLYLMVDDLKKFGGEYFNACMGVQSTIKQVVDTAVKVSGKEAKFIWGGMENRSWDKSVWIGDNTKAMNRIGWSPKVKLEEGLSKMWEWYQNNHKLYNK